MNNEQNKIAYQETCSIIRHYSNASFTVRLMAVVQGFTVLGAWAIILEKNVNFLLLIALPIIGLIFTLLFYKFHMGYFRATKYFYKYASNIEKELFDDGFRPIGDYDIYHDKIYNTFFNKLLTLNATFTFIGLAFAIALILTVIMLLSNN